MVWVAVLMVAPWDPAALTPSLTGERRLNCRNHFVGVRRDRRAKALEHLAIGRHQELLEVPLHIASSAFGVGRLGELGVERVAALAVHLELFGHREGGAVGGR